VIGWIRSKLRTEPERARRLEQAENAYQRGALDEAFNAGARRFLQPVWDGRRLPGGTVLIHGESGFGDILQFVR